MKANSIGGLQDPMGVSTQSPEFGVGSGCSFWGRSMRNVIKRAAFGLIAFSMVGTDDLRDSAGPHLGSNYLRFEDGTGVGARGA